ncbi:hypothetical protein ACFLXZ_01310 [Chloroflexota bacterium]
MAKEVNLLVNNSSVPLKYFTEAFAHNIVSGIMESLDDTDEIKTLEMIIKGDEVTINLNNNLVTVNEFVSSIIKKTVEGMVSSLKGVNEINEIKINIAS